MEVGRVERKVHMTDMRQVSGVGIMVVVAILLTILVAQL